VSIFSSLTRKSKIDFFDIECIHIEGRKAEKSENLKKKFREKPKNAKFLFEKKIKMGFGVMVSGGL
jgi:hypothetical protein